MLGDFIEDKEVENPATQTAFTLLQEQLRTVLGTLPPREQEVLKMRFGLEDGYSLTLEEVGLYFDVTRERIRQIEAKALRRLRHPRRANGLLLPIISAELIMQLQPVEQPLQMNR